MPHLLYPPLIQWRRDACNGMYPSAKLLRNCVAAENHLTAHRHKEVFSYDERLGSLTHGAALSSTLTARRGGFRSGHGATRLRAVALILPATGGGFGIPTAAAVQIDVTLSGGGTTTMGPWYSPITALAAPALDDAPSSWHQSIATIAIDPDSLYEIEVILSDGARLGGLSIFEIGDPTVDEATAYYNQSSPAAGSPIYDADRSRLIAGVDAMLRHNGATAFHWGRPGGTARTRTSATPINLIDNTTTGAPSASSPGFTLDMTYRRTASRSTVPMQIHVYASMSGGGTGYVTVRSSSGVVGACAITGALGWTQESTCPLTAGVDKYDLQFYSDGANTLTVYAVSVIEWEA